MRHSFFRKAGAGRVREGLRSRLWPVPALGIILAIGLGVVLPRAESSASGQLPATVNGYLFSGGPEAARIVLSTIAGSLITVTALTFSLTVITLQLAASQFSPRLLRTFTGDPMVQASLAMLLGTFTYTVTVLRTIRSATAQQPAFVPQLSVTLAFLLSLGAVITLVAFLAHLVRQIRVERLLHRVAADARATVHRFQHRGQRERPQPDVPPDARPVNARSTGFISSFDEDAILFAATETGVIISLERHVGDWIVDGTPLAHAWPLVPAPAEPTFEPLARAVDDALRIGPEPTSIYDPAFGLRQLTDVAVKALSPGINDPTTAVHALSHLSAIMCELADRPLDSRLICDDQRRVRVIIPQRSFSDLLELAFGQPRRYGAAEPDVQARLLTTLREIAWCARDAAVHTALRSQLENVRATIDSQAHYTAAEVVRLGRLIRSTEAALAGHWPPLGELD